MFITLLEFGTGGKTWGRSATGAHDSITFHTKQPRCAPSPGVAAGKGSDLVLGAVPLSQATCSVSGRRSTERGLRLCQLRPTSANHDTTHHSTSATSLRHGTHTQATLLSTVRHSSPSPSPSSLVTNCHHHFRHHSPLFTMPAKRRWVLQAGVIHDHPGSADTPSGACASRALPHQLRHRQGSRAAGRRRNLGGS